MGHSGKSQLALFDCLPPLEEPRWFERTFLWTLVSFGTAFSKKATEAFFTLFSATNVAFQLTSAVSSYSASDLSEALRMESWMTHSTLSSVTPAMLEAVELGSLIELTASFL